MARTHKAKTLTISIDRPVDEVYAYAANPENFPQWTNSFVRSVRKTPQGWVAETTQGPIGIEFAAKNGLGVLDHVVEPAPGVKIFVPMRVVPNGDGAEVIFTLFQLPDMSNEKFSEDSAMVERDLATLKAVLERDSR